MKQRFVTLLLLVSAMPVMAQWLTLPTPGIPRTAGGDPDLSAPVPRADDGHPDLTGLWLPGRVSGDLLNSANVQPWARTLMAERGRSYYEDDPRFRCLPTGPGNLPLGGPTAGLRRIVQNPAVIVILRADMTYRQIFMDGRELEPDPLPTWMGYSVGRWDGDTLVVESNGYNDKTWIHRDGLSHTERLRITERYRRLDFGHIQLDVTYEDPGTFDAPLHAAIEIEFVADDELLETVCNEASEGESSNWSGEFTDAEDEAQEVAQEILARYVGTYTGYWLKAATTLEVTLEDGALFALRTPPYAEAAFTGTGKSRLIPQSENAFQCSCGLGFIFTAVDDGIATEVSEVHISGAWPFRRVP